MEKLKKRLQKFVNERDWNKFHTPENLAKSIMIEGAELLENFQWGEVSYNSENVEEEIADIMIYCIHLTNTLGLDPIEIINKKMDKNDKRFKKVIEGENN
ncbi:nucleotide pyrophosphohydrolase [Streptobacillus canis]|uniref:nucleotide pyrophosphohydrolase n=1 Tax=Streptobacillus canis TaxID=2678686 RepID=UPI0012E233F2|nr:nucleotide pyrophosphohydrolase [Streptobacillus canis]